jgi:hypothetical protein
LVVAVALIAAGSLGLLGLPGGPGAAGFAGATNASVTATQVCRPNPQSRGAACIGRSASGRTVRVRVGQKVEVDLSSAGLRWSGLGVVGPHLLRARGAVVQRGGKLSATYTAVAKGRTALQARGDPVCAPGRPCPQFILLWRVRVDVSY